MISNKRRVFLKGTLAAGTVGVAVGAGLLAPSQLLAAWPSDQILAEGFDSAANALTGGAAMTESADITLTAPEIAENGAVVPVTVETSLDNVSEIAIFAKNNGTPLTSRYLLGDGAIPVVGTRIKMGETSDVIAAVKVGDNWMMAAREVKVTVGGCGG
ncbi:MAG: thiosulfate oxidation carrier protein SoxY [Thioalkalivibrionaceae bacterium]